MRAITELMANTNLKVEDLDWNEVYEETLPRIFHFFCYKVGDPEIAEELTAITFEKAWLSRNNYRKDLAHVFGWLLGIARHVAGDFFRKPIREVSFDNVPEISYYVAMDEDLQHQWEFKRISILLYQLSSREKELIALKYGAELTNREIAKLTGLSESNVGTILCRAVSRLRAEWEQDHEG